MLELSSPRLLIREIAADDLPVLLPIYTSNPAYVEQNEGSEGEIGKYDLERWQRDWYIMQMLPTNHQFACYLRTDQTPIGIIYYLEENQEDDDNPWLGTLVIHSDHQRQGLASEAFHCVTDHFHQQNQTNTVRAGLKAQNESGLAFLKHLGFQIIRERNKHFAGGLQTFFVMEYAQQ